MWLLAVDCLDVALVLLRAVVLPKERISFRDDREVLEPD